MAEMVKPNGLYLEGYSGHSLEVRNVVVNIVRSVHFDL